MWVWGHVEVALGFTRRQLPFNAPYKESDCLKCHLKYSFFKKDDLTPKLFKSSRPTHLPMVSSVELRKILASSVRQNILTVLAKNRELQVMRLVTTVGSTYNELNRNLQILGKEDLIIDEYRIKVRHGKIRVIRLNKENPKTQTLLKVLKTLEQENNPQQPN